MIPAALCIHYWPTLRRRCDAGLRAPDDCHGCPAYYDGQPYLGVCEADEARARQWAEARTPSTPYAHFRGENPHPAEQAP